jgi:hypothetical protein
LADGLCDLGEITSAEGLHDWGRRALPLFLIIPWHLLYNLGKTLKTSVRAAE